MGKKPLQLVILIGLVALIGVIYKPVFFPTQQNEPDTSSVPDEAPEARNTEESGEARETEESGEARESDSTVPSYLALKSTFPSIGRDPFKVPLVIDASDESRAPAFVLTGVFITETEKAASLGGTLVKEGDTLSEYTVLTITPTSVELLNAETGDTLTLHLKP